MLVMHKQTDSTNLMISSYLLIYHHRQQNICTIVISDVSSTNTNSRLLMISHMIQFPIYNETWPIWKNNCRILYMASVYILCQLYGVKLIRCLNIKKLILNLYFHFLFNWLVRHGFSSSWLIYILYIHSSTNKYKLICVNSVLTMYTTINMKVHATHLSINPQ